MKRKELTDKLTLVGPALAKDDLVPMFQNFCFDGNAVTAYNDALGIVAPCQTPKPFAVNGKVLLGLLTNSLAEEVEFNVEQEAVIVKAGKSTFKLPYYPETDFLFEEPDMSKKALQVPINEDFITGLIACLPTSSTDNAQPAFMGICLHQGPEYKTLYSTDGDAISRYILHDPAYKYPDKILPNMFCETLVKVMAETQAQKGTILVDDEWAAAYLETKYIIYGRLLQVDNPLDYEKELAKTRKESLVNAEIPKGLKKALARARVLSDPESAKTVLMVEAKRLKLLTEASMGVVRDSLPLNHPDATANVSAQLIHRCIKHCSHMLIRENCVEFWNGNKLYILTSNMGD